MPNAHENSAPGEGIGSLYYQNGFGNEFGTEAVEGALPTGRNSPQRCAYGHGRSFLLRRLFYDADGEILIVPQLGRLRLATELGILDIESQQVAVVPRGLRFRVELPDGQARGYVCENFGAPLRLPDLGPIGSNGLANPRDFQAPVAWYEDRSGDSSSSPGCYDAKADGFSRWRIAAQLHERPRAGCGDFRESQQRRYFPAPQRHRHHGVHV